MSLTKEQDRIIQTVLDKSQDKIIAVNACAGSGKTFTSHEIIKAYKPKTGFYSAFNKAIVEDSNKRFGDLIMCKTFHALAYKYIRPSNGIEEFNYLSIKEDISYEDKATVINTLDDFYRSASDNIHDYVETNCQDEYLQDLIIEYADKMLTGKMPVTFNYMLKCLHLMLLNKEIEVDFELILFDEVQDVVPVTLEIFKLLQAQRKVMLGDTYQNIYSFMNTVNAFEKLKDIYLLKLTKSFRCNDNIALEVEKFGTKWLADDFEFKGNNDTEVKGKKAFITRTNAMLIERMFKLMQANQSFSLTRGVNEIFALPIALLNAANGRSVYDKKYKYLEKEYGNYIQNRRQYKNYYDYIIQVTEDITLEALSKVLRSLNDKGINIYKLKEQVTNLKPNKEVILTTAHAFKGLEADTVYIEDDLNYSVNRTIQKLHNLEMNMIMHSSDGYIPNPKQYLTKDQKEDLNTYYVALSRAKTKLMNVGYI